MATSTERSIGAPSLKSSNPERRSHGASMSPSIKRSSGAWKLRSTTFVARCRSDGLALDDFEAFGPVQHFRSAFLVGWSAMRSAIAEKRAALVAG